MENEKTNDLEKRFAAVLEVQRCVTYESVEDIIMETFYELGQLIMTQEKVQGADLAFRKSICGLPVDVLKDIREHAYAEDIPEWVSMGADGKRARLLLSFLDTNRLSQEDFRSKFPKAYAKWSEEDDSTLMQMWSEGQSWPNMSNVLQRNVNALKLRLEKLGVNLGKDAGVPRRR
ncbi:MAG: hypothetical protein MJY83_05105 [Bacteroidales bacterium]|nr:hypothetical protein [Bacteroidales bacterium]